MNDLIRANALLINDDEDTEGVETGEDERKTGQTDEDEGAQADMEWTDTDPDSWQ